MNKPQIITKTIPTIDHKATGEAVREFREQHKVSLREVARRLGISPAFLSDLERGRRNWTYELLDQWYDVITIPAMHALLLHYYAEQSDTKYPEALREFLAMDEKTREAWLRRIGEHAPKQ